MKGEAIRPHTRLWLQRGLVGAVIALGFGLRLYWALTIEPVQGSDARMYAQVAREIAAGEGYHSHGIPTAYYPVGYPGALALLDRLFGTDAVVGRLANAVFALGTLLALGSVTRTITRSRGVTLLALTLFALYPADIGYTAVTLSQPFFNALALIGCALCVKRAQPRTAELLAGGMLFGCATLTRHQGAVIPALIAGAWLVQWQRWARVRQALILCGTLLVSLVPWTIRNAFALDALVPISTNGGINLYIGNNPNANGRYRFTPAMQAQLTATITGPRRGGHNEVIVDRLATKLAWQFIEHRPKAALDLWPLKLRNLYGNDSAFAEWSHKVPSEQRPLVARAKSLNETYFPVLLWLGGFGALIAALELCTRRKSFGSLLWLPAAVIAAFSALQLLTFGEPSYHHPMMPWIAIYAGYALITPWRYLRARVASVVPGRRAVAVQVGPLDISTEVAIEVGPGS